MGSSRDFMTACQIHRSIKALESIILHLYMAQSLRLLSIDSLFFFFFFFKKVHIIVLCLNP